MIKIINEDDNIVVYEPDVVLSTANDIMSKYVKEFERHRKQVGNLFNSDKSNLDNLTTKLNNELRLHQSNIRKIEQEEDIELTDKFKLQIMPRIKI